MPPSRKSSWPNRHARTIGHATSSVGSPRCANSQSSRYSSPRSETTTFRGPQHLELLLQRQGRLVDHASRRAAHEQPLAARIDRPRLLRGAAREQLHRLDLGAEALGELRRPGNVHYADWPPSTTRVWPVT